MAYDVRWDRKAVRRFDKLTKNVQQRIKPAIDALARTPRPAGVEKLTATQDLYRIRVGNYRVVYQILDQELIVLVLEVADRKIVYRRR